MKSLLLRSSTVLLLASLAAALSPAELRHVRLESPAAPALARSLEDQGYDVLEGGVRAESIELVVTAAEQEHLEGLGFRVSLIQVGRPLRQIQEQLGGGVPGYPDLAAIEQSLAASAASFPAICELVDLSARFGILTYEGRSIVALRISDNVGTDEDEPAFLMVGAHHCRETVTPLIALEAVERLTTGYGVDPEITAVVDGNEIWIAPVWNPDGYEYVFSTDNLWRKNRRPVGGSFGIDLNRNYPFGWSSTCAGTTSPSSCTYKGPSPASEAETQIMLALSEEVRFAKVIDYHSSGQEMLWGYDCSTLPLASFFQTDAIRLSNLAGYGGANRPPSAEGEHFHWQYATYGSHALLLETATSFQPPAAQAQAEAEQVWPSALAHMKRAISVTGNVTDACSGAALEAQISFASITFSHGEEFFSGGPFGRYDVFLPEGPQTLTFSAPGYLPASFAVSVSDFTTLELDVELEQALAARLVSAGAGAGTFLEIQAPCSLSGASVIVTASADGVSGVSATPLGTALFQAFATLDGAASARIRVPQTGGQDWTLFTLVIDASGALHALAPLSAAR